MLPASTPADLLDALLASDPGRPRVTWYDDAAGPTRGERIELSGKVLANWAAKGANLLVDELDVEPGDVVTLDLPAHWRLLAWALAGWRAGAVVRLADPSGRLHPSEVLVTHRPRAEPLPGVRHQVAVALPGLARVWPGPTLPPGTVDAAADGQTQPDRFDAVQVPAPQDPALDLGGGQPDPAGSRRTGSDLIRLVRGRAADLGWPDRARVLVTSRAADPSPAEPLLTVLAAWSVDGSVVLVREAVGSPDPSASGRRGRAEQVTDVWRPAG
jgi:uncharacterized protein (TIGR03089 family)